MSRSLYAALCFACVLVACGDGGDASGDGGQRDGGSCASGYEPVYPRGCPGESASVCRDELVDDACATFACGCDGNVVAVSCDGQWATEPFGDCADHVVINEIGTHDADEFVELRNTGDAPVNLGLFRLALGAQTISFGLPDEVMLPAGGYHVLDGEALGVSLGDAGTLTLYDETGTIIDAHTWASAGTPTWGRCPDASGDFQETASATKGAANDCGS